MDEERRKRVRAWLDDPEVRAAIEKHDAMECVKCRKTITDGVILCVPCYVGASDPRDRVVEAARALEQGGMLCVENWAALHESLRALDSPAPGVKER